MGCGQKCFEGEELELRVERTAGHRRVSVARGKPGLESPFNPQGAFTPPALGAKSASGGEPSPDDVLLPQGAASVYHRRCLRCVICTTIGPPYCCTPQLDQSSTRDFHTHRCEILLHRLFLSCRCDVCQEKLTAGDGDEPSTVYICDNVAMCFTHALENVRADLANSAPSAGSPEAEPSSPPSNNDSARASTIEDPDLVSRSPFFAFARTQPCCANGSWFFFFFYLSSTLPSLQTVDIFASICVPVNLETYLEVRSLDLRNRTRMAAEQQQRLNHLDMVEEEDEATELADEEPQATDKGEALPEFVSCSMFGILDSITNKAPAMEQVDEDK